MNLTQLESFVRVAELGSFSKAAVVLGVAQPALSRQVRALEIELRETLLIRDGRGVRLSQSGRRMFDHCVGILQQVERAREDMSAGRDEPVGRVVIGLPPSVALQLTVPLIDRFRSALPKARLAVTEGLSTHIAEWITSGRVDLGLLFNPAPHASVEVTPLLEEDLCLVSPASGDEDSGKPLPFDRLPQYPLIIPERGHAIRNLLETQSAMAGLRLNIAAEVSSVPAIIDLVRARHGHAVLTASGVRASPRAGDLAVHPLAGPRLVSVLCLALPSHKKPTPLVRETARIATELVRARCHADNP